MIEIMSSDLIERLRQLGRRNRELRAGEFVFRRNDEVRALYLVERGEAHLVRFQDDGSQLVLQRAPAGRILAEASAYSDVYHCDALAIRPTSVTEIELQRFRAAVRADPALAEAWSQALAKEMQAARLRAELLSLKTVAARLDAWLSLHPEGVPGKGEWKTLAAQLGVTPEALYRELARRKSNQTAGT
jgi:CRP-like cAMP-binding protein